MRYCILSLYHSQFGRGRERRAMTPNKGGREHGGSRRRAGGEVALVARSDGRESEGTAADAGVSRCRSVRERDEGAGGRERPRRPFEATSAKSGGGSLALTQPKEPSG